MKTLHFNYLMQINYSEPVGICHYTIKCIPADTDRQNLKNVVIELEPDNHFCRSNDSFGNEIIFGSVKQNHNFFSFHIEGDVAAGIKEYENIENESMTGIYRYPYGLTKPGEALRKYYETLKKELEFDKEDDSFEKGIVLMHRLYQDFVYEKNITGIMTTAEEAWVLGKGVCQDYAHIMIVLLRLAGIPARYVSGMLMGEGFSHAWVELLSEGRWYALDPTNDVIVTDSHIKLGIGRDASDCLINRGVLQGGGNQEQFIKVSVFRKG